MALTIMYLLLLLAGLLLCLVEAEVHHHDFVVTNKNYTRLCETKSILVVNDQFPGPTIHVRKGDTVFVNVYNHGDIELTLHWHGVKQPRNPWSDGPEYVTQCPIQPRNNFTYEVIFSSEEGTLWWHAHSDWTRNTVHGAIVIHPAEGTTSPYPQPDAEEIIILGSWYTYDVNLVVAQDLATGGDLPASNAYTINGQPGDFCNCSKETTYKWSVDYGKTYLLRIINAVMNAELFFSISGHNLTLVNQDASYLKPVVTSYILIAPGQTMNVLVTANQSLGQYYMAAHQFYTDKATFDDYDKTNVTAILQYNGDYEPPTTTPYYPTSTLPPFTDYNAGISFRNELKSLRDVDVPKNITTKMYVIAAQNLLALNSSGVVRSTLAASLNNVTWVNPWVDVLQAYYKNMSGFYTEDFPDNPPEFYDFESDNLPVLNTMRSLMGTKVKVLEYGEEVEMIFQSANVLNASEDHPMHLHGHGFYMVGAGGGNFDFDEDPKSYNMVDPPFVNTASIPKSGWLAVRFRALNPGTDSCLVRWGGILIIAKAGDFLAVYMSALDGAVSSKEGVKADQKWVVPATGKQNVDATLDSGLNKSRVGIVFRDDKGDIVEAVALVLEGKVSAEIT
ncbi:hypothetical protein LWI29_019889 [Acer saccharum]|uniref:Laccase n=1 Tax=Acer saccharum TaxID=4024 RepID=A0AA39VCJ2_ACESA|nr:hypothetical protein LWI29_019889 [Acer saccharum]